MNEYKFPIIIEITLYKNNLKDNQILSVLNELHKILKNEFYNELNELNKLTQTELMSNINSVYFLNNIINEFINLRFIKINISDKLNYSRVYDSLIYFDFKVLYSKVDLPNLLNKEQFNSVLSFFKNCNLIHDTPLVKNTYIKIKILDFYSILKNNIINEKYQKLIELLYSVIPVKLEMDNSYIMLIIKK
jgi:hypothetical protein